MNIRLNAFEKKALANPERDFYQRSEKKPQQSPRYFVLDKQSENMQTFLMWTKTDKDLWVVPA